MHLFKFTINQLIPCVGLDGLSVNHHGFPLFYIVIVSVLFGNHQYSTDAALDHYTIASGNC